MANTGINNFKADDFRKAILYNCYTTYKVSGKELHGLPVLNAWDRQGYVCATVRLTQCLHCTLDKGRQVDPGFLPNSATSTHLYPKVVSSSKEAIRLFKNTRC